MLQPMSLAPCSLTENALRRLEECNTKLVSWGPLPQVEVLNAQNRLKVMTALLFVYNRQLSLLHKSALEHICKVSSKLVTQGFHKPGHHQRSSYGSSDSSFVPRLLPRIPVSSQFLLELIHAVYFAMFNDFSYIATQALEDIYGRACYEGYAEVILVTSAIRNSLQVNPSGQPSDGPMGISVALSPATTTVTTVNKSMITNASFRTKKLPELVASLTASQQELMERRNREAGLIEVPAPDDIKSTRKWKAWSWRNNVNKGSFEEESQQSLSDGGGNSPARRPYRSVQSSPSRSPASSPGGKPSTFTGEGEPGSRNSSPKKRIPSGSSTPGQRMSAGARLCKVFEESYQPSAETQAEEESIADETWSFFVPSGRPASVSLLQTTGNNYQL
ncbi:hypothetical protein C0J52_20272 [Blattella germanica]|nr:hypothetical protein C0J52_20272 [Blattella germanica]